jgi:hypothetical protein
MFYSTLLAPHNSDSPLVWLVLGEAENATKEESGAEQWAERN